MNLNSVTANLNHLNSSIKSIDFKCNMNAKNNDNEKLFDLKILYNKPSVRNNFKYGKLLMTINITVNQIDNISEPDTMNFVIEWLFSSKADVPDNEFLEMLNINGGAALYSIARSKIELISSTSYTEGKILLPMVNMVEFFSNDKNN